MASDIVRQRLADLLIAASSEGATFIGACIGDDGQTVFICNRAAPFDMQAKALRCVAAELDRLSPPAERDEKPRWVM